MERSLTTEGASIRVAPTTAPTMADFTHFLADAVRQYGTLADDNGAMCDDETAAATLSALGGLADHAPISSDLLADLMEVVNDYSVTACTMARQGRANRAHGALTRLIALYLDVLERWPELCALRQACDDYNAAAAAHTLAEYRRRQETEERPRAAGMPEP